MQADDVVRRIATGVLVACCVVVAVTVCAATVPSVKSRLGLTGTQASYLPGSHIDIPAAFYQTSSRTVILFSRSSCGACQRAKPAVASIAAEVEAHHGVPMVLVTDTTFQKDESAFAREIGISPTRLLRTDLGKLRVKRIPTMVVVDDHGNILAAEEGIPTDNQRRAILKAALPQ